jgi:aspartate 1-decarboxylase
VICLNGAAAWKAKKGDIIIIASYVLVDETDIKKWHPQCVYLDEKNRIKQRK